MTAILTRLRRAWCALTPAVFRRIDTRLYRAWCGLFHNWTLHRGFWRCALCQPEKHTRREKAPPADTNTLPLPFEELPTVSWAYDDPVTGETCYYPEPKGCAGEYMVRVGGPGEPLGP